jgi:hypothetical protein
MIKRRSLYREGEFDTPVLDGHPQEGAQTAVIHACADTCRARDTAPVTAAMIMRAAGLVEAVEETQLDDVVYPRLEVEIA